LSVVSISSIIRAFSSSFHRAEDEMATPLLQTKLYIPPLRPELVPRPRLIEQLNAGIHRKLTLISAPAGFGKTTLISNWVHAQGREAPSVAWLSLDESDDDIVRFWSYAISALQTLEPAIGQAALGALQNSRAQLPPLEAILTSLMNDIATLLSGDRRSVLILDDYHVLKTEAIHESLDYLLDHLPPALRLVIASREDPPLALSLLRGRGQLSEIRAADLRFSTTETAEYLNAVMGLELSADDVVALEDRTEGWAVGLHMAALSLRGQSAPEAHDFVSAFAGDDRYVADYLLDQVLDRQPPNIQGFLIQTSILDRLCGPLCEAVIAGQGMLPAAPYADSQEVLEYLERAGLFVVPLDHRRHWYRYHHLFADLLRSRLEATSGPHAAPAKEESEAVTALHLRASVWYEGEGLIAEAMDHALAAADYVRAADILWRTHRELISFGEFALLRRWLEALPEALIRSRPFLCLLSGIFSLEHSPERAEAWLQAAEQAWEDLPRPVDGSEGALFLSTREDLVANLLDIRTMIADVRGASSEEVIALILQALEHTPERMRSLRAAMFQRLGWCYLNLGDEGAAERSFHQAAELAEIGGHPGNILGPTCGRALIAWQHGRLHDAVAICREALHSFVEPLERSGRRLPIAGDLYIYTGRILLELYELEDAESMLAKGVELAELTLLSGDLLDGYYALACLCCIKRDFVDAYAWMDKAERTCTWVPEGVRALWARIWLWRARVEKDRRSLDLALAWARRRDLERPAENDWELQSLAQAYIAGHYAYGEPDLASLHNILNEHLRQAEEADSDDHMIQLLTLQALAWQAEGQIDQAMALLEQALALAAPHHYVVTFVQHGAPMGALLREAAARGVSTAYVSQLLSALAGATGDQVHKTAAVPGPLAHHPPQPSLLEPLTKREMDVLRLVNSSLSSREIADQLYVSTNTVRTHIRHIYAKLNVHSRTDAVSRACELGLL
jgi:LuxR family maltose regulon positive regulatory protein